MDDNKGEILSETAQRTFDLIGLAAEAITHADGGILELTDDEGATLSIPISRAATLKGSADSNDNYGYYGAEGYNYIGEWDEPAAQELDETEEGGLGA